MIDEAGLTLEEVIIWYALDDWVSDAEVIDLARRSRLSGDSLRYLCYGVIAHMVTAGWIVLGDVKAGGFRPWDLSPGEAIARMCLEWSKFKDPFVLPGDVFWLDATASGEALGEGIGVSSQAGETGEIMGGQME